MHLNKQRCRFNDNKMATFQAAAGQAVVRMSWTAQAGAGGGHPPRAAQKL
jgi:hypothetical protein